MLLPLLLHCCAVCVCALFLYMVVHEMQHEGLFCGAVVLVTLLSLLRLCVFYVSVL